MDIFSIIAEDKIKRAIEEGEFDHLPGKGKPLKLEDLSHIPEDLRIAYKVMKNSNMLEDVDKIKEELLSLDDLLATCDNPEDRVKLKEKKNEKELRLEQLLNKRKVLDAPASAFYKEKIIGKLTK